MCKTSPIALNLEMNVTMIINEMAIYIWTIYIIIDDIYIIIDDNYHAYTYIYIINRQSNLPFLGDESCRGACASDAKQRRLSPVVARLS